MDFAFVLEGAVVSPPIEQMDLIAAAARRHNPSVRAVIILSFNRKPALVKLVLVLRKEALLVFRDEENDERGT